jgi:hypothetical protein
MLRAKRTLKLVLVTVAVASAVLTTPGTSLAASRYPITAVSVKYYPMYTANTTVFGAITAAGCLVLGKVNLAVAGVCAAGVYVLPNLSQQQQGYWGDYVIQTSQVIVHEGAVCNQSKTSCSVWQWDVYSRTGSASLDNVTVGTLLYYGPYVYGYSQVGYGTRMWWINGIQFVSILSGNGI